MDRGGHVLLSDIKMKLSCMRRRGVSSRVGVFDETFEFKGESTYMDHSQCKLSATSDSVHKAVARGTLDVLSRGAKCKTHFLFTLMLLAEAAKTPMSIQ